MPQFSISEAARLAQISRSSFYKTYINQGRISISKDDQDKPCIELSELLRVFPDIQQADSSKQPETALTQPQNTQLETQGLQTEIDTLRTEVDSLKTQLEKSENREQWLQKQVENLTDTVKLLEAPKHTPNKSWWQFWK